MGGKIKQKAAEPLITVSSFRIKIKNIKEDSVTPIMNYKNR